MACVTCVRLLRFSSTVKPLEMLLSVRHEKGGSSHALLGSASLTECLCSLNLTAFAVTSAIWLGPKTAQQDRWKAVNLKDLHAELSFRQIGSKIGRSQTFVSKWIKLGRLHDSVADQPGQAGRTITSEATQQWERQSKSSANQQLLLQPRLSKSQACKSASAQFKEH